MKFKNRQHLLNTLKKINKTLQFSSNNDLIDIVNLINRNDISYDKFFMHFWKAKNKTKFIKEIDIWISDNRIKTVVKNTDYIQQVKSEIEKYNSKSKTIDFIALFKKYKHSQECYNYITEYRKEYFNRYCR